MNEIAAERVAEAPESIQGILTRCYNGKCSPRAAIKAFLLTMCRVQSAGCDELHGFGLSAAPIPAFSGKRIIWEDCHYDLSVGRQDISG